MVLSVRTVLCLALAAAGAGAACTPEEDPSPYVVADTPIETDNGQFTISLRAAEGRAWPDIIGPTVVAAHIEVGPDPPPNDPQFHGEAPEPPFTLELAAGRPRAADEPLPFSARAWPLSPDGFKWLIALDFKAAGDWALPLTIFDARGRGDSTVLVFHVEDE